MPEVSCLLHKCTEFNSVSSTADFLGPNALIDPKRSNVLEETIAFVICLPQRGCIVVNAFPAMPWFILQYDQSEM